MKDEIHRVALENWINEAFYYVGEEYDIEQYCVNPQSIIDIPVEEWELKRSASMIYIYFQALKHRRPVVELPDTEYEVRFTR